MILKALRNQSGRIAPETILCVECFSTSNQARGRMRAGPDVNLTQANYSKIEDVTDYDYCFCCGRNHKGEQLGPVNRRAKRDEQDTKIFR